MQHFEHVAHLYLNEAAQNDIIGALSGEKLCMDEELALDDDQLAFCQEVMEAFMPPALDVLFKELEHAAHSVCHDLYDICPHWNHLVNYFLSVKMLRSILILEIKLWHFQSVYKIV